ncbi:MAG: hypothetical protein HYX92_22025 [Chloroflexi bacterium]|nr:hypothetical protein [Chloroflexota bacterium]
MEIEKLGLPAVTFCSEEFEGLGRGQVRMLGRPTLPIVTVPHPVGGQPRATVERYADDAFERVVKALTLSSREQAEAAG